MTKEAIERLVREAFFQSDVETALLELMSKELDPRMIAAVIWLNHREEFLKAAAAIAAEEILPF